MSNLYKYLKYKKKYLNIKMLGGFSFSDTKNDDYFYKHIINFLDENNTKLFFNYDEKTNPIKTYNDIIQIFNSKKYLDIYEYLISIYYDPTIYMRTYKNNETYRNIHKYHIHFAALILINYFAELELHTLFYHNIGINTVSKPDRNHIKSIFPNNESDDTYIYLDDVYSDINIKIYKLCEKLDTLFEIFMRGLINNIAKKTNIDPNIIFKIINPNQQNFNNSINYNFKTIVIDWKKKVATNCNIPIGTINEIIIDSLKIFIHNNVHYISVGFGFYDFMYITYNKKMKTNVNYGSCIVQSLFELYIMSRLHTKPENMVLVLEAKTPIMKHSYHTYIQSKLNIFSVSHWSTEFNLSDHQSKHSFKLRTSFENKYKINFSDNKLDFAKACFYSVYDLFNTTNNKLNEKKSLKFEKFINNRILFFENKLYDKLYENSFYYDKCFYNAIIKGDYNVVHSLLNKEWVDKSMKHKVINRKQINDENSIFIASYKGHTEILKLLLDSCEFKNDELINVTCHGITPLYIASREGHIEIVELLIKNGSNVNMKSNNMTPLQTAVENNHPKIIELLIKNGADINMIIYGSTLLYIASHLGHKEIVELLIKNGSNIDMKSNGMTPLYIAVRENHLKIVELLIKNGADINVIINGMTPLYLASISGYKEIVELLVKNGADVNKTNNNNITPLYIAIENNRPEIVELLIQNGADINMIINGMTPLYLASISGHKEIVELLVKNRADVNKTSNNNMTPLHIAVQNNYLKIVELLIQNGADINMIIDDMTPLYIASGLGHIEIVELLIKNRADVNKTSNNNITPLHMAVQNNYLKIVELLIKNGANVNKKKHNNATPLYIAVENNRPEIVELLIQKGADINILVDGMTLLYLASSYGYTKIVELLIKNGDNNINVTVNGMTPLYFASSLGYIEIVELLIKNGVDVNKKTIENITPLYMAVQNNYLKIVELLIQNGANINMIINGMTPLYLASSLGHIEMVELLIKSGANINKKNSKNVSPYDVALYKGHTKIMELLKKNI